MPCKLLGMEVANQGYRRLHGHLCAVYVAGDGHEHQKRDQTERGTETVYANTTAPPPFLGGTTSTSAASEKKD